MGKKLGSTKLCVCELPQFPATWLTSWLQETQFLQSTHEDQLFGVQLGDLTIFPLSRKI